MKKKVKESVLIIYDPLGRSNEVGHNDEIAEYASKVGSRHYSKVLIADNFSETKVQYQFIHKLLNVTKILVSTLKLFSKALRLQKEYSINIFNPNEDLISLALLLCLRKVFGLEWRFTSRFICTRDRRLLQTDSFFAIQFSKLLQSTIKASDKLSAETDKYAKHLSALTRISFRFVPYPPIDVSSGLIQVKIDRLNVFVPGAAREDKGFDELPGFIEKFAKLDISVMFLIQEAHEEWLNYSKTITLLKAKPNVSLLPSHISGSELSKTLKQCNILLLPYNPKTYSFRGSAFGRRGMYLGKMIITHPHTSLGIDAGRHNLLLNEISKNLKHIITDSTVINYQKGRKLARDAELSWEEFLQ